jgi:hypothetical protein
MHEGDRDAPGLRAEARPDRAPSRGRPGDPVEKGAVWTSARAKCLLLLLGGVFALAALGYFTGYSTKSLKEPAAWLGTLAFLVAAGDVIFRTLAERWGRSPAPARWAAVAFMLLVIAGATRKLLD